MTTVVRRAMREKAVQQGRGIAIQESSAASLPNTYQFNNKRINQIDSELNVECTLQGSALYERFLDISFRRVIE